MKKPILKYTPRVCERCQQTTTYASRINKGMIELMRVIANAIHASGTNDIKMGDMVKDGRMTHNQHNNRSHVRAHGLIAALDKPNHYRLTKKGSAFLRGESVPSVAVVDKRTHENAGYVAGEDGVIHMTNIKQIMGDDSGWWDGWNYEITSDGRLSFIGEPQPQLAL